MEHKKFDTYFGITKYQDDEGGIYWYKNGKLHNDNGPAIVHKNGTKKYYCNGFLHNANGPAIVGFNVNKLFRITMSFCI